MDYEDLGLRYLQADGDFCYYDHFTQRKKIDCLNKFRYLSPGEYYKFKQNKYEPSYEEKQLINKYYIGTKRSWILNNKLRTGQKLKDEEVRLSNLLKNVCQNNRCPDFIILRRYVDLNFLAQYDITFDKFNEASARKGLDLIKKKLIYNIVRSEKGFMSASYGKTGFDYREILLLLYCPEGVRMYVTDNDDETEVILQYKMNYTFFDAYLEKVVNEEYGYNFYRIVICCFLMGRNKNEVERELFN